MPKSHFLKGISVGGGFSATLRESTSGVHTRAEKTAFIRGFLRGTASREAYTRLLAALYPVYSAMEREMSRLELTNPQVARFQFQALHRTAALERDLVFLAGKDWRLTVPEMEEGEAYAERVHQVAYTEPVRLVGHLYTRYMGDMAGGQILARIAERSLGLQTGAGLDFYDFSGVEDLAVMKELFRNRLDELGSNSPASCNAVIEEAVAAFQYNIAIFEQLKGNALLSFFRNLPLPWVRAARLKAAH